ncbi:hypothetical protein O7605_03775 [Verrucosispora sp. WMMA2121]|uniref:hypothetical protein n=1 Tax=unclassified Micromonospora TaxID=2617518 RepID=UPI0022B71582|nr:MULTISPECIES: hypothetical protein [unclassified Micromonospora]MCZ7418635.1 hypothetical protein [Verrucosispora sp. WMMA2121]WFE46803.1 hypothetical protein O7624_21880 [Verrucosispora sp. WMMD1129]
MARIGGELRGRTLLNDATVVHDRNPVGELPDDGEVMADEQARKAELVAQVA